MPMTAQNMECQLADFLASAKLEVYYQSMIEMGYDDLAHILRMSAEDSIVLCKDIFGPKKGHR